MTTAEQQGVASGNHRAVGGHLTFKGNRKDSRYGWLRLTPAYSLTLVDELLDGIPAGGLVLDPFCGTGTTALACGQRGIDAVTTDINPFLIWLTDTKCAQYAEADLGALTTRAGAVAEVMRDVGAEAEWLPPIHQIEKWWDPTTLHALGRGMAEITRTDGGGPDDRLIRVAFCRTLIERASVSFGHQSMSFKKRVDAEQLLLGDDRIALLVENWEQAISSIRGAAANETVAMAPRALLADARSLTDAIEEARVARVVTSPPYPNRMSYIRELRPYLYWLGYLNEAREAGELDWKAIGGTWGMATSWAGKWEPTEDRPIPFGAFSEILERIGANGRNGPLLSRYVHKYFFDMVEHVDQLFRVMAPGAVAHYIVGNSKFYDTVLPVEEIYAAMFRDRGFDSVSVRAFRKRSSKKELFEFVVSATRPGGRGRTRGRTQTRTDT